MNKSDIVNIIDSSAHIKNEDLVTLEQLTHKYPYAHAVQLLYLKGLKQFQDLKFEEQLPTTSIQTPNRKRLYEYVIKEDLVNNIKSSLTESGTIIEEETKATVETENPTKEAIPSVKAKDIEPVDSSKTDEIEQAILEEISNYQIEDNYTVEKENIEEVFAPAEPSKSKQSFSSWLHPESSITASKTDLIDKFLETNPSISKNKGDLYSAPNLAKMSVVDDLSFVTETLARVYLKQGHYDKAIKTYEQLSLKNPEKKSFFASQIEVITELKKQQ